MQIRCSYFIDSLGDLVRALSAMLTKSGKSEIHLTEESGGGCLFSLRRDGEMLEVTAKRLRSDWDEEHVEQGRQTRARLRWRGPFQEGARVFVAAFDRLIAEVGVAGYAAGWWRPLPEVELRKAREALE